MRRFPTFVRDMKIKSWLIARARIHGLAFCLFCLWALAGDMARSQTASVSGSVDALSSDSPPVILHGVKVLVRDLKTKKIVGQPLIVDHGTYTISSLRPGDYEIFACDSKLDYEPVTREAHLKDGSSPRKDIHLRDDNATVVAPADDRGRKPGSDVKQLCLVHKETGCKAARRNNDTIMVPGPPDDFEVLIRGGESCE